MPSNRHPGPRKTLFVCMLYVCPDLCTGWLYVCHIVIVKPALFVGSTRHKRFVPVRDAHCPAKCVLHIYRNPSVRFCCWLWFQITTKRMYICIQVCVTVVGFGFK